MDTLYLRQKYFKEEDVQLISDLSHHYTILLVENTKKDNLVAKKLYESFKDLWGQNHYPQK